MAERWIGVEIILTVFSKSGVSQTKTLGSSLETSGAVLLYEGYCPWEGQWFGALDWLRPDVFVTAKYEAWPDLWSSLAALDIPLTVVSARARNSLAIVRRFAKLVGVGLPDLTFTVTEDSQSEALRSLFPEARIEVTGDPRWDRAIQRSKGAVRSTDHLTARFSSLKC
jgi:3-deoxy-D-manno-octulosonic-acid transferase